MREDNTAEARELAERNRELAILNAIASALNEEVDLSAALNTALAKGAELLGLRTGWIWLLSEDEDQDSYLAASLNLPPALRRDPQLMEGSCYCLRTFRTGDLNGAANVNVVSCSRLAELVDGTDGLRYHTSVPLYASHGKKLGVLNVAGTEWRELSSAELQLLYTIGDLLSITIERARHFARSAQIGAAEERNRLAREIHDTLAQNLAAITLQLETADALMEADTEREPVWAAVRKALDLSRAGLLEARRSVLDLRAVPLEGRSLAEAVTALSDEFSQRTGVQSRVELVGANLPLSPRIEIGVYRIIQEALANIEQHADAGLVKIILVATPLELNVTIDDNGRGFRPDHIPTGHFGLIGINERVHLLGGTLDLQSSPREGTRLRVKVPLVG
ncbi:MAG: GAF domain-containing sensor histidine kinase [Candidatus Promineifilaceae bacterium]|nr:GAF domain-containing sensor histidine kinase [Candidatus Promineifilaceae bacterium]